MLDEKVSGSVNKYLFSCANKPEKINTSLSKKKMER